MVNEKQDSFGGQLAKWITPILLTVIGFAMREYYISINSSLEEMKDFMTTQKVEVALMKSRLLNIENSDAKQNIILQRIDNFFLKPEEIILKRKK